MSKKYIILVLILFVLVLVGSSYYYWKTKMRKSPTIDTRVVNPTESLQNPQITQGANPYDKTNPFSNIKVNPFE